MAPVGEGLHQERPVPPRSLDDLGGIASVHRERLLAQDVLARVRSRRRTGSMIGMTGRDVNDLDLWVGDERLVAAVVSGNLEFRGEVPCPAIAPAGDSDQPTGRRVAERPGHDAGNLARAHDPPSASLLHDLPICYQPTARILIRNTAAGTDSRR